MDKKQATVEELFEDAVKSLEQLSDEEKAALREQIYEKYLPPSQRWVN